MIDAFEFVQGASPLSNSQFRFATVDSLSGSNPIIKFDGEQTPSSKIYKRLGSYAPTKGDRVLLVSVSGTYVILGKVI